MRVTHSVRLMQRCAGQSLVVRSSGAKSSRVGMRMQKKTILEWRDEEVRNQEDFKKWGVKKSDVKKLGVEKTEARSQARMASEVEYPKRIGGFEKVVPQVHAGSEKCKKQEVREEINARRKHAVRSSLGQVGLWQSRCI